MPQDNKITPIPSYLKKIQTLADKSIQLVIETQELTKETAAYLFGMHDKYGFFLFLENAQDVDLKDIPESAPEFKGEKTPSQRLRAVLYVLWENLKTGETFDTFYKRKMGEITDHFKRQLPEQ